MRTPPGRKTLLRTQRDCKVGGYACDRCNCALLSWTAYSAHLKTHGEEKGANPDGVRGEALAALRRAQACSFVYAADGRRDVVRLELPEGTWPETDADLVDRRRRDKSEKKRKANRQQLATARFLEAVAADASGNRSGDGAATADSLGAVDGPVDDIAVAAADAAEGMAEHDALAGLPHPAAMPPPDGAPRFEVQLLRADWLPRGVSVIEWTDSDVPRELPPDTALSYRGVVVAIHRHMASGERECNRQVVDQVAEAAAEVAHGLPAEKNDPGETGKMTYFGWRWERRAGRVGPYARGDCEAYKKAEPQGLRVLLAHYELLGPLFPMQMLDLHKRLSRASYLNVGDDARGIHTPWHHQALSINHTSAAHAHPMEFPGFNLWYFTGEGAAPHGKWRFHLSKLNFYVNITHGGVLWFDSKQHHHTEGPRGGPAAGDKEVIGAALVLNKASITATKTFLHAVLEPTVVYFNTSLHEQRKLDDAARNGTR